MISKKLRNRVLIGFCGLGKQSQKLMQILKNNNLIVISGFNKQSYKNKQLIKKIYPNINFYNSINEVINSGINTIFIVTNHKYNFKFAKLAIEKKINVFVEKPLFKNNT